MKAKTDEASLRTKPSPESIRSTRWDVLFMYSSSCYQNWTLFRGIWFTQFSTCVQFFPSTRWWIHILHLPLYMWQTWLADVVVFMMSCGRFCFLVPFLAALLVAGEEKVDGPVIGDLLSLQQLQQLADHYGWVPKRGVPKTIGFSWWKSFVSRRARSQKVLWRCPQKVCDRPTNFKWLRDYVVRRIEKCLHPKRDPKRD